MAEDKVFTCNMSCAVKAEIDKIVDCVAKKTPMRLFYWAFGGLCFFTVVIMGGLQWKILDNQKTISVNIEVVKARINGMRSNFEYHIKIDDVRHLRVEDRINDSLRKQEGRGREW